MGVLTAMLMKTKLKRLIANVLSFTILTVIRVPQTKRKRSKRRNLKNWAKRMVSYQIPRRSRAMIMDTTLMTSTLATQILTQIKCSKHSSAAPESSGWAEWEEWEEWVVWVVVWVVVWAVARMEEASAFSLVK